MAFFATQFRSRRIGCTCGLHGSQSEHEADGFHATPVATSADERITRTVEKGLLRAVIPHAPSRRAFLKAVGTTTAAAAIAQALPVGFVSEVLAQSQGPLEKTNVRIGFIPITCATPIIMAEPMGFYERQGLQAEVAKTAGWAVVRDMTMNGEYDAAHMLAPMPLAITMGLGATARPFAVPAIENVNGQAICLSLQHRDNRDPANWAGMRFAVPFDYSNHNYLLRYYLAEHGIDPDADVQLRVVPPPDMVANLRAGNIDGFLAPDNVVQRAVYDGIGFIHILSKEIWDGHPCCSFSLARNVIDEMPNTSGAMMRAIMEATAYASVPENRAEIATAIAPTNYLNQPETVVQQVLTGTYADGLGNVVTDPNRVAFDPFPWESFAIWTLTQMKRWGQVQGDIDYAGIASQVYLATDARRLMEEAGLTPPAETTKTFSVMGKAFDPADPEGYLASFPIKRS